MFEGIDAAMLMLRATRTGRPARWILISVRLVSSSSNASSRISALSSLLDFAAVLSSGWRAMILIQGFLLGGFLLDDGECGRRLPRRQFWGQGRRSGAGTRRCRNRTALQKGLWR